MDTSLTERLPLESQSSSVSSLVTLVSPGVVADSNGLFHGLGDHAENSFSVDGQPITDQQSKVFSNQIPLDSIQSLEAVSGGPPAEYGDKTSLVIKVTTKSGLGAGKPTGSVYSSYGSFGSVTAGFRVAMGNEKFGNFIAANGLNTSRFLDPPELHAIHDKGNEENLFDRFDYAISGKDSVHVNFQYTRSWFQTPNTIDNLNIGLTDPVTGAPLPLNQDRKLTNTGLRADLSYVKGAHNIKVGGTFQHTFLTEDFKFGITDPDFLRSQVDSAGNPCFVGGVALDSPCTDLLPFDLTQAGSLFPFHGHTDVKELALYAQDTINEGNWAFNVGIRFDVYRGIVHDWQPEPRLGVAYNLKKTNSVLRVSYSRVLETPFNENLILASTGASNPVITDVIGGSNLQAPIRSGQRNQFNAGFQQAFGKYLVVDADYLWKYTHNAFDFSTFGNTPIFFPISWKSSKIDGPSVRVSLPNFHGLTALAVLAHVRARYFPPQIAGLGATITGGEVFRIDHDQAFNQTTHFQYQPFKSLPWVGFNWRYDSGLVASNPNLDNFSDASSFLDADQQTAIGLFCVDAGGVMHNASLTAPLAVGPGTICGANPTTTGAKLLNIAGATFDVDHNPTRVKPRNLFDASVGDDNLFQGDKYKWSLRFTVINMTNETAPYNFLSTFSGTHFVTPRAYTVELGFHF